MTDPFDALRAPVQPTDPDPIFAARLRERLRKEILERGSRGLSNKAVSSGPSIEVHSGRVWIIVP